MLGLHIKHLLIDAIKIVGTYDPDVVMVYIGENLTRAEYKRVYDFLSWVHRTNHRFGTGNFEDTCNTWSNHVESTDLIPA